MKWMLLFILQNAAASDNTWYYVAQFVPVLSTVAGIGAMVVSVWSKRSSERNGCTLEVLMEKMNEQLKNTKADADLVKQLKAQLDTLVAVAPVVATAAVTSSQTDTENK